MECNKDVVDVDNNGLDSKNGIEDNSQKFSIRGTWRFIYRRKIEFPGSFSSSPPLELGLNHSCPKLPHFALLVL